MKAKQRSILGSIFLITGLLMTSCNQASNQASYNNSNKSASNIAQSTPSSEKIELRFRPRQGESFRARMTVSKKMVQELQGSTTSSENTLEAVARFEVKTVAESGQTTLIGHYETVRANSTDNTSGFQYDSKNPESSSGPQAKLWQSVMANTISMVVSATGQVEEAKGIDALIIGVLDSYPPARRKLIEPILKNTFGDQFLKDQMKGYFVMFPEKPVGVGESWTGEQVVASAMPLIMKSKLTLTKREGGIASIHIESTLSANPEAPPLDMGSIIYSYYDLQGTQQADVEVDEKTGWIKKSKATQTFTGTMEMIIEQLGFTDSNIPIHGEAELTFESLASE